MRGSNPLSNTQVYFLTPVELLQSTFQYLELSAIKGKSVDDNHPLGV